MRRFSILFIVLGFISISTSSHAQMRGLGASSLILDDNAGHTITIQTPTNSPPNNPEYMDWQAAGFPSFSWTAPIPPSSGATAGFVYSGPLSPNSVPYPLARQLLYWVYPSQSAPAGNNVPGGATGAWDYATEAQLGIVAGSGNLNAIPKWVTAAGDSIGNSSITDDGSFITTTEPLRPFNVECQTSTLTLNSGTHFIDFYAPYPNGTPDYRGGILGEDLHDYLNDDYFVTNNSYLSAIAMIDTLQTALAIASGFCSADPFESPLGLVTFFSLTAQVIQLQLQADQYDFQLAYAEDHLGVQYTSAAGDYAEYLRRADTNEHLYPGDIVGMTNGVISKKTAGAQSILSISLAPIVLGNMPPKGEESHYSKVAFLGQVPVKVRGMVNAGDFIVPSGLEDGTGIAVSPESITPSQFTMAIGRAWNGAHLLAVKSVMVAVGLNAKAMSEIVSREQSEIDTQRSEIDGLKRQVSLLENSQNEVAKIEAELQSIKNNVQNAPKAVKTSTVGND